MQAFKEGAMIESAAIAGINRGQCRVFRWSSPNSKSQTPSQSYTTARGRHQPPNYFTGPSGRRSIKGDVPEGKRRKSAVLSRSCEGYGISPRETMAGKREHLHDDAHPWASSSSVKGSCRGKAIRTRAGLFRDRLASKYKWSIHEQMVSVCVLPLQRCWVCVYGVRAIARCNLVSRLLLGTTHVSRTYIWEQK
jgi:hypothetical protein